MYIICNRLITAKNLKNPKKLSDVDLIKSYMNQLRKENASFIYRPDNTIFVKQYLSCFMSANGEIFPDFTNNPKHALDMKLDIADQLLRSKCVVGGNAGWRSVKNIFAEPKNSEESVIENTKLNTKIPTHSVKKQG